MKYLIDTNICIYIMKEQPTSVINRFKLLDINDIDVSEVTISELFYGVEKSQRKVENHQRLNEFLMPFTILPYRSPASTAYAKIRAELEKKG